MKTKKMKKKRKENKQTRDANADEGEEKRKSRPKRTGNILDIYLGAAIVRSHLQDTPTVQDIQIWHVASPSCDVNQVVPLALAAGSPFAFLAAATSMAPPFDCGYRQAGEPAQGTGPLTHVPKNITTRTGVQFALFGFSRGGFWMPLNCTESGMQGWSV